MTYLPIPSNSDAVALPLRDRLLVVVLVVLVHVALLWSWAAIPGLPMPTHHEMSVSVALPGLPQAAALKPELEPQPAVRRQSVESGRVRPEPQIATADVAVDTPAPLSSVTTGGASAQAANASAGLSDREPDYLAAYLQNPPPSYPMVARRMGWQGRVVLNVEVLSSGLPGQVRLQQSSGHDVLDNAALQAVRGWRFVAARQGGQVVTKWFLVPIPFILKEAE